MTASGVSRNILWAGIILILVTGLIHLVETPEYLEENTTVGVLFILNVIGSVVSAAGIYRHARDWGWGLGVLVAGGAFVAYVLSRTTGFLGFYEGEWGEPLGVASLVVEALFVIVAARALSRPARRGVS